MEDKDKQNQGSGFWWGLIVGAVAAGLAVLLLDKEDKEKFRENIKGDWEKILEKIREITEGAGKEKNKQKVEVTVQDVASDLEVETVKVPKTVKPKPAKKFFKKNGRKIKTSLS